MSERYPGYDVSAKRWTPSWDAITRSVIDRRLSIDPDARFLTADLFIVLQALCDRILPQEGTHPAVPLAAFVDRRLLDDKRAGYRNAKLPPMRDAWLRGLRALDDEARCAYGRGFAGLDHASQDSLIARMKAGKLESQAWGDMACALFFSERVMAEIPRAYYAHPAAWNEIGFGGPASPRGYVRLDFDKRDPWEAAETLPGREDQARKANTHVGR